MLFKGVETKLKIKKFMKEVNHIENSDTLSYEQKQEKIDELKTKLKTENSLTQSGFPLIDQTSITNKTKNSSNTVEGKNKEYHGLGDTSPTGPTSPNDQTDESSLFRLPDQRSYIEKLNNKILEKLDQSSAEEFVNSNT